jgi:hypothetical protein
MRAASAAAEGSEPASGATSFPAAMKNRPAKDKRTEPGKRADGTRLSQATSREFEREGMGVAPKE